MNKLLCQWFKNNVNGFHFQTANSLNITLAIPSEKENTDDKHRKQKKRKQDYTGQSDWQIAIGHQLPKYLFAFLETHA